MAGPLKVIWTDTVPSDSRTDPSTGLPLVYRLMVYASGAASCSCPDFLYRHNDHPKLTGADTLRFKCKHLVRAFAEHDFSELGLAVPTPESAPAPEPPRPPEVVQRRVILDDLGFDTDTTPRIRR